MNTVVPCQSKPSFMVGLAALERRASQISHLLDEGKICLDGLCLTRCCAAAAAALLFLCHAKFAFFWFVHCPTHVMNAPVPSLVIHSLCLALSILGWNLHLCLILLLFLLVWSVLLVLLFLASSLLTLAYVAWIIGCSFASSGVCDLFLGQVLGEF